MSQKKKLASSGIIIGKTLKSSGITIGKTLKSSKSVTRWNIKTFQDEITIRNNSKTVNENVLDDGKDVSKKQ